jgi:1,4-dihydroxy-2-naphthoate octaprenyltransferase
MAQAVEPLPAALLGRAPSRVLKRYWLATRPGFFPASVLPVVVGTLWGRAVGGHLDWAVALLALLATALVHAGANVLNDVGDEICGSDRTNSERIFPYTGGSRFIQNEIMTLRQMATWGLLLLAGATLLGGALAALRGPTVIWLGVAGVALATLYSLPPVQLQGRGMGEVVIAIAFGVLPVSGAAWLQSGVLDGAAVLVSIPVGIWVTAILLINEVPDIAADARAGKRTLPVRIGVDGTRRVYIGLQLLASGAVVAAVLLGDLHWIALLAQLVLLPIGFSAARGIGSGPGRRSGLQSSIERTLLVQTIGCLTVALGAWLSPLTQLH